MKGREVKGEVRVAQGGTQMRRGEGEGREGGEGGRERRGKES